LGRVRVDWELAVTSFAQQPLDDAIAAQEGGRQLLELEAALDSVLSLRHAQRGGVDNVERRIALLRHEIRLLRPDVGPASSADDVRRQLRSMSEDERKIVASRALYYACHDLITLLAHKYVKGDAIAQEEGVLYVQDRLQRDDFRRVRNFDPCNGAAFRTYIWQVISHLLIDFTRSRRRVADTRQSADAALELDERNPAAPEAVVAEHQRNEVLAAVLQETSPAVATVGSLRERLRAHLDLSSTERLFLKAMFLHDMSVEEVRELPGFEMTRSEAWRFYYRLMDRLLDAFKDAGVVPMLRTLLDEREPTLQVTIERQAMTSPIASVTCVRQRDSRSSWCHLARADGVVTGVVMESFTKLRTRLAPWFSPINPETLVADHVLAARSQVWRSAEPAFITIDGIAQPLPVGRTQAVVLRRRFAGKIAS
jgi:hypothetical protein